MWIHNPQLDLFRSTSLHPSHLTVGKTDFHPFVDTIDDPYLHARMQHKRITALLVGRILDCRECRQDNGFVVPARILCLVDENRHSDKRERD